MKHLGKVPFWSVCLGNMFEHYDTALFGYLSPVLATVIFPGHDPLMALILTYAIIPLGMIARPIGSLVFGSIGDRYGRRQALILSLGGMTLASGALAACPPYLQAGLLSPILFCLCRSLQNFMSAGEVMGGAIFLLENCEEQGKDVLSGIYSAMSMGGHLLAAFAVYVLLSFDGTGSGWRMLYLLGCITGLFGCLLRYFPQISIDSGTPLPAANLKTALAGNLAPLLSIVICSGFANATFAIAFVLMTGFIPLVTPLQPSEVMGMNTYLLAIDFCALLIFGWVASVISREKLMLASVFGIVFLSIPLLLSLEGANLTTVLLVRTVFILFGVAFFAPFHAWAQQLVPPGQRYTVVSLGYALGTQLFGSPAASLSLWCFRATGHAAAVSYYWIALALAAGAVIAWIALENRNVLQADEQWTHR